MKRQLHGTKNGHGPRVGLWAETARVPARLHKRNHRGDCERRDAAFRELDVSNRLGLSLRGTDRAQYSRPGASRGRGTRTHAAEAGGYAEWRAGDGTLPDSEPRWLLALV